MARSKRKQPTKARAKRKQTPVAARTKATVRSRTKTAKPQRKPSRSGKLQEPRNTRSAPEKQPGTLTVVRAAAETMKKPKEKGMRPGLEAADDQVTINWGPASSSHSPAELQIIIRKLQSGAYHDVDLGHGSALRFSTRPVPGAAAGGGDMVSRVGRPLFYTYRSSRW